MTATQIFNFFYVCVLGVQTDAGDEGDGDVYNPANVQAFYEFVMSETKDEGVHFMMADGVSLP